MKRTFIKPWTAKKVYFSMRFKEAQESVNTLRKILAKKYPFKLNRQECSDISRLHTHLNIQILQHLGLPNSMEDEVVEKEIQPKTLRRVLKGHLQRLIEKI